MPLSDIIGHERQLAYFHKVLDRGTAAHAYVLSGPRHVGKLAIAERFVAAMLGVERERLFAHPDVITLARPFDDKTGERKRQIPLDHVRVACDRLALSAVGGRKAVIIEDADAMTVQAQNALLKTLEEPSGSAVLVLVAEEMARLLPTILSRSVTVSFSRVSTEHIVRALVARGFAEHVASEAAERSYGRPGLALEFADADRLMEIRKQTKVLEDFLAAPRYERIKVIAGLVKGEDAKSAEGRESWLLDLCGVLRAKLHAADGQDLRYISGLDAVLEARDALRENGNVALALERVALALP